MQQRQVQKHKSKPKENRYNFLIIWFGYYICAMTI